MCMSAPKLPDPVPFVPTPAPPPPPPADATAQTVGASTVQAGKPRSQRRNPLRTDQGNGSTDSVATGLNIPV